MSEELIRDVLCWRRSLEKVLFKAGGGGRAPRRRALLEASVEMCVVGGFRWRRSAVEKAHPGTGAVGAVHQGGGEAPPLSPAPAPRPLAAHPRQEGNKRTSAVMKNSRGPSGKTLDLGFLFFFMGCGEGCALGPPQDTAGARVRGCFGGSEGARAHSAGAERGGEAGRTRWGEGGC